MQSARSQLICPRPVTPLPRRARRTYFSMKDGPQENETNTTTTVKSSSFECFSKLSTELRLKIWKIACFFPRNIDIWAMPISGVEGPIGKEFMSHPDRVSPSIYWSSHNAVPALLHASSESRTEGLKFILSNSEPRRQSPSEM